jgi:ATP-binding cassette, subfamily F, member 3
MNSISRALRSLPFTQAFIDKFRYNAKRAGLVQSRLKAVERMEVLEDLVADPRWVLEFPDPGPLLGIVLQVKDVTFGYDPSKPPLLRKVNFGVGLESRIAVCGPNGIGKLGVNSMLWRWWWKRRTAT